VPEFVFENDDETWPIARLEHTCQDASDGASPTQEPRDAP
jgi:hypothetical protein